jgi:hypothetical protein
MIDDQTTATRQQLHEEIWAAPMKVVAERYGISDVGLAKICRKLLIPIPGRGYWAKQRAGKPVPGRPPLPALKDQGELYYVNLRAVDDSTRTARQQAKADLARASASIPDISAPPTLSDPHPLIVKTAARLSRKGRWTSEKGLRSAPSEVLDVSVTEASLDRALLIMDTLIKAFAAQGVSVHIDKKRSATIAEVGGTPIELSLNEYVRQVKHEITPAETRKLERERKRGQPSLAFLDLPRYDYQPTGVLTFVAGRSPSRSWRDTARSPLETRLKEVVAGTLALALEARRQEAERQRKEAERQRAREQYAAIVKRRNDEAERLQRLENDAVQWTKAEQLRAYVSAVESHLRSTGGLNDAAEQWLAWARAKADRADPLINVSDLILDAPEPEHPRHW